MREVLVAYVHIIEHHKSEEVMSDTKIEIIKSPNSQECQLAFAKALEDEAEVSAFPPVGKGFSHCENGLCYVSCGAKWLKLEDANGNHIRCGNGSHSFECDGTFYVALVCK